MSFFRKETITLTTDASGDATGRTQAINGRVINVIYTKVDFDNGVDFAITNEGTGQSIWAESNVNASAVRAPRQPTHAQDGTASLFAASGEPVESFLCLAGEAVKIVIAQGGNAKSGTFTVVYG